VFSKNIFALTAIHLLGALSSKENFLKALRSNAFKKFSGFLSQRKAL
jgi:hypothetical protein